MQLLQASILVPTHSPHNTAYPGSKEGISFLFQDLRKINEAIVPTSPVVPSPYILLSTIPPAVNFFTVLDHKGAFFTIPLHPWSQSLFTFTWQDPETQISQQLTWTDLPQGFQDSPHFFRQALQKDLQSLNLNPSHLLQYVDGLLCTPT